LAKLNYLFVKNSKGKVKVYFLLLEGDGFYLSCLKPTNQICGCGSELIIYAPNSNTLKRVERPFSFSLKRNLINRLANLGILELEARDFKDLCNLLYYLGGRH
jgi:hypothetical protein